MPVYHWKAFLGALAAFRNREVPCFFLVTGVVSLVSDSKRTFVASCLGRATVSLTATLMDLRFLTCGVSSGMISSTSGVFNLAEKRASVFA